MRRYRRRLAGWILMAICSVSSGPAVVSQEVGSAKFEVGSGLSSEAIALFLERAEIGARRAAGGGVTGSIRATLTDGTMTHDAHIQIVDISRASFQAGKASEVNFTDNYRYNIAAYRLSRLLGMDNVPVSIERKVDGKMAAVTWWIDDVQMTEKERLARKTAGPKPARTAQQLQVMQVFDELIQNKDRNQGNIVWTNDWTLWLIDHTRAFRTGSDLLHPDQLLRCDRELLQHLRGLTSEALSEATDGMLTTFERKALLARRDRIVQRYDQRIAKSGEVNVLFDLDPPDAGIRATR